MALTLEQEKVINSNSKISICLAVPGSGKTFLLLEKAKKLVRDFNEPVLILTFTNTAVDDLAERIPEDFQHKITVKTIHAYCLSILQQNKQHLEMFFGGDYFDEIIVNEDDFEIYKRFRGEGVDHESDFNVIKGLRAFGVPPQNLLNLVKRGGYLTSKMKERDVRAFRDYEFFRLNHGYLLFDDLVPLARNLMSLPEVSVPSLTKYSHVLVDEAQDTSEDQWEIIRPLVAHARTSLIVGDVNQSIYEWRGASSNSLINLGFLKEAVTFRMTQSFRNSKVVADLANKICVDKSSIIRTEKTEGSVAIKEFSSLEAELSWVLSKVKLGDVIIGRTNAILEKVEQLLLNNKIPYNGSSYQKDPHIIDLTDFCREHRNDPELVKKLKEEFLFVKKFTKVELEDINYFIQKIEERGCSFLFKPKYPDNECVTLSTGHSSKGLEWDNVFLIGMNKDNMPHKLVKEEKEELNLFYVMVTRAKKNLVITHNGTRTKFLQSFETS